MRPLPDLDWLEGLRARSITTKLTASLLVLMAVMLVALTVTLWGHDTVRSSLHDLADVAEPLNAAADEMEINAIGSGLAVAQYVRTRDPAQRARLTDDVGDFRRANARYRRLADTPEERVIAARLRATFETFVTLGRGMIARRDERELTLRDHGPSGRG